MTSRWDMVDAGKTAVRLGVQYIFGAKPSKGAFRVYSRAEIQALRNAYGSMIWDSDFAKAGSLCCDCSGLMTYATGDVVGSSQLYEDALERVPVSQIAADWSHYVGWVLWLPGHVGIVSDTPNYYYALDGSARNSVHLPLWNNSWKYALKIRGVDYEEDDVITEQDLQRIADKVWLTKIDKVAACDRLQGIDKFNPQLSADAVWAKKLKADGGAQKNMFEAWQYLSKVDARCDRMEDVIAEINKKLDRLLAK